MGVANYCDILCDHDVLDRVRADSILHQICSSLADTDHISVVLVFHLFLVVQLCIARLDTNGSCIGKRQITKRCTGVAAGGCSVFRASTGRNPVNAVVIPGRITSFFFRQVDDSVMARKSWLQFYRLSLQEMCRCPASSVRKMFYSLHSCCDRDHSLTVMTGKGTRQSDTVNPFESEATCGVRSSFGNSSDCCDDIWAA
jgi:hypothetical protein